KKESYLRVFVELNNKLVRKEKPKAKKMLLLLPHCIQASSCDIRLTFNVLNCKRCGKCEIKDLIQIAEERDLSVFIAAGGSQARRIIKDIKPESVIAAACENDLSSGIVDTYPLPVLGILNERPFGPCLDTRVDLEKVKEAIEFFSSN
ncbi:MAG: DUF116 domain-containing protein, partial [Candidatus Saganbacteria bacterium]|nr:DUF116 domain-containing protein [Candidatus Saganbacteria bacterium]